MVELILGILAATVIILLLKYIQKRLNYFSQYGIAYVKPTLMSLIKSLSMNKIVSIPSEIYKNQRGGNLAFIGYFHSFLTPSVLILDPDVVECINVKYFSHFQDHGVELDFSNDPLHKNLFNMKGNQWRTLRHKILPAFTSGKLKGMVPIMEKCASTIISDLEKDVNRELNLKEYFKKYSLCAMGSTAYGLEPESLKDPNCEFKQIMELFLSVSFVRQIKIFFILLYPSVAKIFKLAFFPQAVTDFYLRITNEALEMRKMSGVRINDFVQLMLELKEKGSVHLDSKDFEDDEEDEQIRSTLSTDCSNDKLEITDELLAAQAFVFILGGFDSVTYIVATVMYMLCKHKDVEQNVREEVRQMKNKHRGISYLALKDMKLLDACIKEVLRMHPPVPILLRSCNKKFTYDAGQTIEKGMWTIIPVKELQNDSKYWAEPDKFIPQRFLNDRIYPGTYLPFGNGPRACIGQRLAVLMVMLIIAESLDKFEVLPSRKTQEPLTFSSVFSPDFQGGLWASFKLLNQQ